jgi:hypothetical protein
VYNSWWYVGRPTLGELRQDLRALMPASRDDYEGELAVAAAEEREEPK